MANTPTQTINAKPTVIPPFKDLNLDHEIVRWIKTTELYFLNKENKNQSLAKADAILFILLQILMHEQVSQVELPPSAKEAMKKLQLSDGVALYNASMIEGVFRKYSDSAIKQGVFAYIYDALKTTGVLEELVNLTGGTEALTQVHKDNLNKVLEYAYQYACVPNGLSKESCEALSALAMLFGIGGGVGALFVAKAFAITGSLGVLTCFAGGFGIGLLVGILIVFAITKLVEYYRENKREELKANQVGELVKFVPESCIYPISDSIKQFTIFTRPKEEPKPVKDGSGSNTKNEASKDTSNSTHSGDAVPLLTVPKI